MNQVKYKTFSGRTRSGLENKINSLNCYRAKPVIYEGKWDYTFLVLIKVKSKSKFENWYNSDEYQEILKRRLNAVDLDTFLIHGLLT